MPSKPATSSTTSTNDEPQSVEQLPEWAQSELKQARSDAAKYRTRAKEAADDAWYDKATKAVAELDRVENERKSEVERMADELNTAKSRASDAERSASQLRAAMRAGFTGDEVDDIASRLRGATDDELDADAKALRERFSPKQTGPRPDLSQGSSSATPLNGDPLAAMLRDQLRK